MNISIFGKELFSIGSSRMIYNQAFDYLKKSKFLVDFYQSSGSNIQSNTYFTISESITSTVASKIDVNQLQKEDVEKGEKKETKTPKDVYTLKTLNDGNFILNTNTDFVNSQLDILKTKMTFVKDKEFDMNHAVNEMGSMIMRLENRKKYSKFKEFFENFPYTTADKIDEVLKENENLKLGESSQFVPDFPKEAVSVMKDYTSKCKKLCNKKPVFYVIAEKKDFEKTTKRKDPILLVQSPFGHFWQILGAWDKEMVLLEDL